MNGPVTLTVGTRSHLGLEVTTEVVKRKHVPGAVDAVDAALTLARVAVEENGAEFVFVRREPRGFEAADKAEILS